MTARQVEVTARVIMAAAYVAVCASVIVMLVPSMRQWVRYRAQLMDYHLALIRWELGSRPAPEWTSQLSRDDLPEEVERGPDGPSGGL